MGNKGGKRSDVSAAEVDAASVKDADPPPLCAADADGLSDAAVSLRGCGVACVRVDDSAAALHRACFDVAKDGMDHCEELVRDDDPLVLDDSADSGHATGVHVAGWGSAYNQTREGFVFSDGATFGVPPDDPIAAARFEAHCAAMHTSALALARGVLAALERDLGIQPGWFEENFGPIESNSQWHVKRYRPERASVHAVAVAGVSKASKSHAEDKTVLLPVHTDPSLVSIVLHDAVGTNDGAAGLEFLSRGGSGSWVEVPHHGHEIATVFIGSVLDRITGGVYPAARHRVAVRDPESMGLSRVAATFFWRPAPTATLRMPPSPKLPEPGQFKQMLFSTWCKRVAKRYEAHKNPQPKRTKKKKENVNPNQDKAAHRASRSQQRLSQQTMPRISADADERDTRLSLLGGPILGREKYLGGALGSDGKIYAIPGFARRVLRIDPADGGVEYVGPEYPGEFKWLRSVTCPKSGAIYGLPCHANTVLKIVPGPTPLITEIGGECIGAIGGDWKWHGGVLSPHDGCIYCIPQFAERVLKIDPATDSCELIGGPFPGRNKWYGGLMGTDGCIYGVPQNAEAVLRIDPATNGGECTLHGKYPAGGWKWHGGTVGMDGAIYGVPAHADTVLKITPGNPPTMVEIGSNLRTGKHRTDGKYKFLGGVLGKDGCVYFIPSDSDHVLQIDCETDEVREVGESLENERIVQNKWQNGFVGDDGTIWGIPLKGETVLTVKPPAVKGRGEVVVKTVGGPFRGLNKWEGGVMSADGRMYCMPLNHKRVLAIDPFAGGVGVAQTVAPSSREGMAATAGMNHD